jgi:hypothetical protein
MGPSSSGLPRMTSASPSVLFIEMEKSVSMPVPPSYLCVALR